MSDGLEHLSDHEWRLEMARQGRAIYVPGKTSEEIRAARAEQESRNAEPVAILVPRGEASKVSELVRDQRLMNSYLPDLLKFCAFELMDGGGDEVTTNGTTAALWIAHKALLAAESANDAPFNRLEERLRDAAEEEEDDADQP